MNEEDTHATVAKVTFMQFSARKIQFFFQFKAQLLCVYFMQCEIHNSNEKITKNNG